MSNRQQLLAVSASHAGFKLLDWRPFPNSTSALVGHAVIEMPSGLVIPDIPAFQKGGRISVGLPSKPLVAGNGVQLRDETGKRRYSPTISFATPAARTRWGEAIAALLEAEDIEVGR
jgi:hypothetical protein